MKTPKISKASDLRPKTFAEWLGENATDDELSSALAEREAIRRRDLAAPTYGAAGEALADAGLSTGGFRAYLESDAERTLASSLSRIAGEKEETAAARRTGYADYLSSYDEKQKSLVRKVTAELRELGTLDEKDAYAYAKNAGLADEGAMNAAIGGVRAARRKLYEDAVDFVRTQGYGKKKARAYAESLGLPESDVKKILSLIEVSFGDDVSARDMTPEEFMEYLRYKSGAE